MNNNNKTIEDNAFLTDVINGLSQSPKTLPCKWFYDEVGSHLFEAITQTAEYYLTRTEASLLPTVAHDLNQLLPNLAAILEPGSGSSIKTRILLSSLPQLSHYFPMDISGEFLVGIAAQLRADYPKLSIAPIAADFTQLQSTRPKDLPSERLVFFPGSTIGNFSQSEAIDLLSQFHLLAGKQGYFFLGVDGTQSAAQLIPAYDDATGYTAQFNQNLLVRANNTLCANFDLEKFKHTIRWVPNLYRIEMHLESLSDQTVMLEGQPFEFSKGETIFTESCHKYPYEVFTNMANKAGWQLSKYWQDTQGSDFALYLFQAA